MGESVYNNCKSKNKELIPIVNGDHESPYEEKNWKQLIEKKLNRHFIQGNKQATYKKIIQYR